ncbi:MAG: hypothetical protein NTY90_04780 [Candidatus Micrarchaeota archaeon]|nr:hypothetical protein [Candidatus Micrarchaeota archaeon]
MADSVTLIKCMRVRGLPELLRKRYSRVIVPQAVFANVVEAGRGLGKPHVVDLEKDFAKGFFERKSAPRGVSEALVAEGLGAGEAEAVALAKEVEADELLVDEKPARKIAVRLGIHSMPLAALIIAGAQKKAVSRENAKKMLEELLAKNYRISAAHYISIIEMVDEA